MSYNYDIQDMNLTSIAPFGGSEYGTVLDIGEQGGVENAHIVIEIPFSENHGSTTATVQHCDTPDGEFTDTELTFNDNAGSGEKRWRIPLDMKRYIRLHATSTSDKPARLTVRV